MLGSLPRATLNPLTGAARHCYLTTRLDFRMCAVKYALCLCVCGVPSGVSSVQSCVYTERDESECGVSGESSGRCGVLRAGTRAHALAIGGVERYVG